MPCRKPFPARSVECSGQLSHCLINREGDRLLARWEILESLQELANHGHSLTLQDMQVSPSRGVQVEGNRCPFLSSPVISGSALGNTGGFDLSMFSELEVLSVVKSRAIPVYSAGNQCNISRTTRGFFLSSRSSLCGLRQKSGFCLADGPVRLLRTRGTISRSFLARPLRYSG